MPTQTAIVGPSGLVTIPAAIRKRLKIRRGTRVNFTEDNGRLILQPLTADSIDRATGSLAGGPSLLEAALRDRREEKKRALKKERKLMRSKIKSFRRP